MEPITFLSWLGFASQFGLPGLVLVLWYFSDRSSRHIIQNYRDDMQQVLKTHEDYMREIRQMYENNVKLVESYEGLAGDLKDVVILNTKAMTRICDDVESNQYCPQVRLKKEAEGVQI